MGKRTSSRPSPTGTETGDPISGRRSFATSRTTPTYGPCTTLSDDGKEAVLGFETVFSMSHASNRHAHHADGRAAPHMAAGRVHPTRAGPPLLAARPALDISAPLARSAALPGHPVRAALRSDGHLEPVEELLAYTTQLRPFDGIAAPDITPGWGEDRGYIALFGEPFEAVTLFGDTNTIRRSDAHRPVTLQSVLETHSLANCLRHILWRFRDDPATGAREMSRYLHRFYPPGADDYRFVLDAIAKFFGFGDFPGRARRAGQDRGHVPRSDTSACRAAWVGGVAQFAADRAVGVLV